MVSTFGTANATILATARLYFSMARMDYCPRRLGIAHPRFHTPAASLVVQGIWSVLLLFSGTFDTLTDTLIFVSWAFYAVGAYGVFVLRRKQPDAPRPYKVPGYPLVPWMFILLCGALPCFTVYNDVTGYRAAVAAGKPALINSAFGTALTLRRRADLSLLSPALPALLNGRFGKDLGPDSLCKPFSATRRHAEHIQLT